MMENKIIKETEWLKFILVNALPKTKIYSVWSKSSDCELGIIKWHPSWRHYCYFQRCDIEIVLSDRCSIDIGEFILSLNKDHLQNKLSQEEKHGTKNIV